MPFHLTPTATPASGLEGHATTNLTFFSTSSPHGANATLSPAAKFFDDLLSRIPLPRWGVYAIFVAVALILLIICLCICIKCCCKKNKKKQKGEQGSVKDGKEKTSALIPSDALEVDYGSTKMARGNMQYSLEYNVAQSELTVGIKQAKNLNALDVGGTSDPYVKVYITPDKTKTCETKVFRATLNPVFNEQFTFQLSKPTLLKSTVVMKVFDFNRFTKHEIMGELRLELCNVDWNHVIEEWQELAEPAKFEEENLGEICFSLRFVPTASKLTVVILEAKNLKSMDIGGSSDPYVKLQLALDKRKWKKRKTSIKKKSLNPYYNEAFTFDVTFQQIQRAHLIISVWDHDAVSRNDAMGKIFLGCDATGNQLRHWADMLSNPRRPVAQWHTLLSAQQVNSTLTLKKKLPIPSRLVGSSQRWNSK